MFQIREEHNQALSVVSRKAFEDRMVEHLKHKSPERFVQIGDEHVRNLIRNTIILAESDSITKERDVAGIIALMFSGSSTAEFNEHGRFMFPRAIRDRIERILRHSSRPLLRAEHGDS